MGLCSRLELLWAEVCSMLVGLTGGFVLIGLQRATGLHGQLLVEVRRIPETPGNTFCTGVCLIRSGSLALFCRRPPFPFQNPKVGYLFTLF